MARIRAPLGTGQWTVTVPEGWEGFYDVIWTDLDGRPTTDARRTRRGRVRLGDAPVNVFTDPCHWKDSLADPPVGPTVDDLVNAFLESPDATVSGRPTWSLGGYPAKRFELSLQADLDVTTCDEGTTACPGAR